MSEPLNLKLTTAGQTAIFNAQNNGLDVTLTHIQFGTGHRVPDRTETALISPAQLATIGLGQKISDSQIRMSAVFIGASNYEVCEIGIWAGEPGLPESVLFAYTSEPAGRYAVMSSGVDFVFSYDMSIDEAVGSVVKIIVDPNGSAMIALMASHEAASNPHPQYATRESPTFVGNPGAPTPAQFDSSTQLATTAFVQRASGNLRGTYTTSSSGTLGAAQAGMQVYVFKGGTTQTINFDELVDGSRMVVYANYTEDAPTTLKIEGSAKFIAIANSLPDALTLNRGEALSLVVDKSNINIEVPTANLRYSTAFRARFGPVGFQELPSGLIIQWGVQNLTSGNADTVVFPIAFPNDCMRIAAVDVYAACNPCSATPNGKTSFIAYGRSMGSAAYAPTTLQYIALGY